MELIKILSNNQYKIRNKTVSIDFLYAEKNKIDIEYLHILFSEHIDNTEDIFILSEQEISYLENNEFNFFREEGYPVYAITEIGDNIIKSKINEVSPSDIFTEKRINIEADKISQKGFISRENITFYKHFNKQKYHFKKQYIDFRSFLNNMSLEECYADNDLLQKIEDEVSEQLFSISEPNKSIYIRETIVRIREAYDNFILKLKKRDDIHGCNIRLSGAFIVESQILCAIESLYKICDIIQQQAALHNISFSKLISITKSNYLFETKDIYSADELDNFQYVRQDSTILKQAQISLLFKILKTKRIVSPDLNDTSYSKLISLLTGYSSEKIRQTFSKETSVYISPEKIEEIIDGLNSVINSLQEEKSNIVSKR